MFVCLTLTNWMWDCWSSFAMYQSVREASIARLPQRLWYRRLHRSKMQHNTRIRDWVLPWDKTSCIRSLAIKQITLTRIRMSSPHFGTNSFISSNKKIIWEFNNLSLRTDILTDEMILGSQNASPINLLRWPTTPHPQLAGFPPSPLLRTHLRIPMQKFSISALALCYNLPTLILDLMCLLLD